MQHVRRRDDVFGITQKVARVDGNVGYPGLKRVGDEDGGLIGTAGCFLTPLPVGQTEFVEERRSWSSRLKEVEFVPMVKVVCGALWQIECPDVLIFAQLVLEFVGQAEFVIRAELEVQAPKKMSVPLWSRKILNERARQSLCVDNGSFVV